MTHEEWLAARRYTIIRSRRTPKAEENHVVASGLPWEEAKALRDKLSAEYAIANPGQSSWTGDIFICDLEGPKWDPRMRTDADRK